MTPITEREHTDLVLRVDKHDTRFEKVEDRVDKMESRQDRVDGMMTMLRLIFGASVIGAITGILALAELIVHSTGGRTP